MQEINKYTAFKDKGGKFLKGNPGGGKTKGTLNYGGLSRPVLKTAGQVQGEILLNSLENLRNDYDMIWNNLMEMCRHKNEKALLAMIPLMFPRTKDIDINKQDSEVFSLDELKIRWIDLAARISDKLQEGEQ